MKIDLTKFTKIEPVTAPIVGGWGKYKSRKLEVKTEDGWYRLHVGPTIKVERDATQLEVYKTLKPKRSFRVFALGTEGVPINFDNFFKLGYHETETVHFLNLPIFSVAKATLWDDGRFYYFEEDARHGRDVIQRARDAFEERRSLSDVPGVTPELRYYFLLLLLQRESYEALREIESLRLTENERANRIRSFTRSFSGRLKDAIDRAGGEYISHSKRGNDFLVEWSINGERVKTIIRDDLRVVSAGFCLSGEDKRHSISSLVNLAKLFQEESPLYITRE